MIVSHINPVLYRYTFENILYILNKFSFLVVKVKQ